MLTYLALVMKRQCESNGVSLSNTPKPNDYAQQAADELMAAAREQTLEGKRKHLNQAAIFAALDEQSRCLQLCQEQGDGD
jgi:hypothetical protein